MAKGIKNIFSQVRTDGLKVDNDVQMSRLSGGGDTYVVSTGNGYLKKGSFSVSDIESHVSDLDLHREIDDSDFSVTGLWSSYKINTEIENSTYIKGTANTYADLPAAADHSGEYYLVNTSTWLSFPPKLSGVYYSDGVTWARKAAYSDHYKDETAVWYDDGDISKRARFELSGVTSGNTRIMTVPDKDITIADNADLHTQNTDTILDEGGVGEVAASDLKSHLIAVDLHRVINDLGTSDEELWSSDKINSELGDKEDAFAKNTAFNKDFGTASDEVARGNHAHDYAVSWDGNTTNDTFTEILLESTSAQYVISDNQAVFFRIDVMGVDSSGNDASFTAEGIIKRLSGAGTTSVEVWNYRVVHLEEDSWDIQITADTATGGLKLEVKGSASNTTNWRALGFINVLSLDFS